MEEWAKLFAMDADERDICIYLKSWPNQFVAIREICRRAAGKKRFREDPTWAAPVLGRLVEKGIVESDSTGHYRLRPRPKTDRKKKRWMSPEIRRILERSGKKFEGVYEIEDPEELPE